VFIIMNTPNKKYILRLDVIAFVIIAASFALRYWFVDSGQLNLVQDEAQYWDWIRRPQLSYYSKGPLIAWIITTWCTVFGNTEMGVRFGAVLGMTGIQAALYIGVSRVWREHRLALYVLFIAATMPLLNGLGILMTTDNPLIFCWTVGFFALAAATRNKPDHTPGDWPFIILGICLAVGILAKYMMLAFLGLGTAYAIILQFRGQLPPRFWLRFLIAAIAGTIIGLLPIALWNIDNDWVGFRHVAKLSTGQDVPLTIRFGPFLEMLGAQIGLLAPWWLVFILMGSRAAIKKTFFGPIGSFDHAYRRDLQATLFFWPLWAAITLWALKSKVEANWTAAAFIGGALLGGMALQGWWEAPHRKTRGKALLAGVAIGITLFIFASPQFQVQDTLNPTHRLKGWSDLGNEIDRLKQTEFDNPDTVFFMSDKYNLTSELAFYSQGQPFAYCAWIDNRRMNQYDLWPGPDTDKIGWDTVMVRKRFQNNTPPELVKMFDSVSEPIFYQTTFHGRPARKFTLFICKNFNGYWPRKGFGKY
jgi:4-amino-4-deoxy-L-arabinose transferase-like glycosyltransferase